MRATTANARKQQQRQAGSTDNQLDETLNTLRNVILNIACNTLVPSKPCPSLIKIKDFAIQVALVMTGIRSGYLVDTFILRVDDLARFMEELQLQAPSELAVCWETTSEQAFFINHHLLESRILLKDFPSWISVTEPLSLTSEPSFFRPFLDQIMSEVRSIHNLQAESQFDGCPLAAFFLEYTVGFVVETDDFTFLSDISLCVYECSFDALGERLAILMFSVPAKWDTEDISSSLQDKFERRIGKRVYITRTVRTFDRVAL